MTTATTNTNEPQTAAFQAAVDNVWIENRRNARNLQNNWNFQHQVMWDRWDYAANLEIEIRKVVQPISYR